MSQPTAAPLPVGFYWNADQNNALYARGLSKLSNTVLRQAGFIFVKIKSALLFFELRASLRASSSYLRSCSKMRWSLRISIFLCLVSLLFILHSIRLLTFYRALPVLKSRHHSDDEFAYVFYATSNLYACSVVSSFRG